MFDLAEKKNKCHHFLDSLSKVFDCSHKFRTLQWSVPAEGKSFFIIFKEPNLPSVVSTGNSFLSSLSCFSSNDFYRVKAICFHEHFSWTCKCISEMNAHESLWKLLFFQVEFMFFVPQKSIWNKGIPTQANSS